MTEIPVEPHREKKGKEVIAKWKVLDMDNEQVFYTDSNGLEMQERKVDYRPTWDLQTDMKVSANYFPVNSAIAVRDQNQHVQMTVMNDRSQGGSSLQPGAVELMQNRRLMYDDNRGVGEALNEENSEMLGIAVNAKYFVQIFDYTKTKSIQRKTQLTVDEPMQYFFAMHYKTEQGSAPCINCNVESCLNCIRMIQDFDGDLKIHAIPEQRNQILIRLENIADLFDGTPSDTPTFDLKSYAASLYSHSNSGKMPASITITERTLSNSEDYKTMESQKFHWKSTDLPSTTEWPKDDGDKVALQPQRIRLFRINYEAVP